MRPMDREPSGSGAGKIVMRTVAIAVALLLIMRAFGVFG